MYRITGNDMKPHFCSSYYLAQRVAANLNERYNANAVIAGDDAPGPIFDYNVGGMHVGSSDWFTLSTPGITLRCSYHDWGYFKTVIEKRLRNQQRHKSQYDEEFYKLRGAYTILCLTSKQRDLILQTYDAYKDQYDKDYRTWHEAIVKEQG